MAWAYGGEGGGQKGCRGESEDDSWGESLRGSKEKNALKLSAGSRLRGSTRGKALLRE